MGYAKMKNTLIITTAFFLAASFMPAEGSNASLPDDNFLWIEFGDRVKEKDGSLTQLLNICYGKFSNRQNSLSDTKQLTAFYTMKQKDNAGNDIFYTADIEKKGGINIIEINSVKTNRITVMVTGKNNTGRIKKCYLAKTSFVLFGKSADKKRKETLLSSSKPDCKFDMRIAPEHSYWPQTGNPLRIELLFDKRSLYEKKLHVFDKNLGYSKVNTGKTDCFSYVPPEDKRLNQKSETSYKQTVLAAEETAGGISYRTSYTLLLHRSRYGNMNTRLGTGIFASAMAVVFITVAAGRRTFRI